MEQNYVSFGAPYYIHAYPSLSSNASIFIRYFHNNYYLDSMTARRLRNVGLSRWATGSFCDTCCFIDADFR